MRHSCGCQVALVGDDIPGVAVTLTDPKAPLRAGWFPAHNTRHGDHYVYPCEKHMPGVIVRWGTNKIMGAVRKGAR